jgi:hypothetical protein
MLAVDKEEIRSSCKRRLRLVNEGEITFIMLIAIQYGVQICDRTS